MRRFDKIKAIKKANILTEQRYLGITESIENVEYDVPEWAISALINGDESGMNDEDVIKLNQFVQRVVSKYGNANFMLGDIEGEDNLGFKHHNDIDNLGSNVYRLYIRPSNERNANQQVTETGNELDLNNVGGTVNFTIRGKSYTAKYVHSLQYVPKGAIYLASQPIGDKSFDFYKNDSTGEIFATNATGSKRVANPNANQQVTETGNLSMGVDVVEKMGNGGRPYKEVLFNGNLIGYYKIVNNGARIELFDKDFDLFGDVGANFNEYADENKAVEGILSWDRSHR